VRVVALMEIVLLVQVRVTTIITALFMRVILVKMFVNFGFVVGQMVIVNLQIVLIVLTVIGEKTYSIVRKRIVAKRVLVVVENILIAGAKIKCLLVGVNITHSNFQWSFIQKKNVRTSLAAV